MDETPRTRRIEDANHTNHTQVIAVGNQKGGGA